MGRERDCEPRRFGFPPRPPFGSTLSPVLFRLPLLLAALSLAVALGQFGAQFGHRDLVYPSQLVSAQLIASGDHDVGRPGVEKLAERSGSVYGFSGSLSE